MSNLSAAQEAFSKSSQVYMHKKLPTLQLMSLAAKFHGQSNTQAAAEQINLNLNLAKTEGAIATNNNERFMMAQQPLSSTAPPIQLTPNPNYMTDVRPRSAALGTSGGGGARVPVIPGIQSKPQAPSQVASLLSQEVTPEMEAAMMAKAQQVLDNYAGTRGNGNILSGANSENYWRTSNQSSNESAALDVKKPKPKPAENIAALTSPITGELLGDFGTWRQDVEEMKQMEASTRAPAPVATDASVIAIIGKLREQLVAHGAKGVIGLSRKFKIMDDDGSNSLSLAEFTKAFKELKLKDISTEDIKKVFNLFDKRKAGVINFDGFLEVLAGPLNQRRKTLVNMAFDVMDVDGNGVLEPSDVISAYNCSMHPEVMSGKRTKEDVLREFLDGFDIGGVVDGKVTREEFENYYQKISASIENDDYFELMIRNAWRISGGTGMAANTANRRVLVTRKDGTTGVEEIQKEMGLKAKDRNGMMARLQAQGVDVAKIDTTGAVDDDVTPAMKSMPSKFASIRAIPAPNAAKAISPAANNASLQINTLGTINISSATGNVPQPPSAIRPKSASATSGRPASAAASKVTSATSNNPVLSSVPPGLQFVVKKLKEELKARGANGFSGLQRKFKIMDDDGSKSLSQGEFKKAMTEMKLGLAEPDIRRLFEFFDTDKSGYIDFNEFINGIREPMTERRLKLVRIAFSKIDKDGSGIVDVEEALSLYDVSRNPEVMSGQISKHEAIMQFLAAFEVGGDKDGFVTVDEFINYYSNLSASIENDDYFELMIRNAWRISGGTGMAANTANRRVLATRGDGMTGVEEIQNELGLRAGDKSGMIARLQAQGLNVTNVDTTGAVDDDSVNIIERSDEVEAQIVVLKKKAVIAFNEKRFNFAESIFQEIISLISNQYDSAQQHPELLKAQKSIQLIKKKAEPVLKTKK